MKIKSNTIISILITFSLLFNLTTPIFALDDNANKNKTIITDEFGNTYQISIYETEFTRTTKLTDINGNVILSLIYNIETGVLYNPDNGAAMILPISEAILTPCKVLSTNDKDYEYEFCTLGDSYKKEYSITANDILNMAATTVLTVAIVEALLVAIAGGISFDSSVIKDVIKPAASAIFTRIDLGDLNFTIYYELKYSCAEFYESDWSYPDGGFWFLGYAANVNYYSIRLGK